MTIDALTMLAGAFVAVLPFLGLPNSWDAVLLLLAGVGIVALGIVVRRRLGMTQGGDGARAFAEHERKNEDIHDPL